MYVCVPFDRISSFIPSVMQRPKALLCLNGPRLRSTLRSMKVRIRLSLHNDQGSVESCPIQSISFLYTHSDHLTKWIV